MGIFDAFKKKVPAPPSDSGSVTRPATGHLGDDHLLAIMAEDMDLSLPRDWVHYLYFSSENAAQEAAEKITAQGWQMKRQILPSEDGSTWGVIVRRDDMTVNEKSVPEARAFFTAIATELGGEYDGWEAAFHPNI
ncbi:MAG: ribonuclease E inhibitor RraB [Actinomycetaceae bacterium]|nr:ribonuclease E inhibitor RraB [Actinomycetaceae bacterium]